MVLDRDEQAGAPRAFQYGLGVEWSKSSHVEHPDGYSPAFEYLGGFDGLSQQESVYKNRNIGPLGQQFCSSIVKAGRMPHGGFGRVVPDVTGRRSLDHVGYHFYHLGLVSRAKDFHTGYGSD